MEDYYSQVCFTCRQDKRLAAYHHHIVTWYITADRKHPVPDGARFGGPCRTCTTCFNAWVHAGAS